MPTDLATIEAFVRMIKAAYPGDLRVIRQEGDIMVKREGLTGTLVLYRAPGSRSPKGHEHDPSLCDPWKVIAALNEAGPPQKVEV